MAAPSLARGLPQLAPALPGIAPKPGFGVTDAQAQLARMAGFAPPGTSFGGNPTTGTIGQNSFVTTLSELTGGAVDSDPRAWTPAEAAAQSERAIARIAQVNPEAARELAEARGAPTRQPDQPWWKDVAGAFGVALKVTGVGAALELLGRPLHAIAETFADEENDNVWENLWQGLSGESKAGFGQVLDKYDVLTGDSTFERIAHNTLAFTLDVGLDPVTYATFGLGSIGRRAATVTAAKMAVKTSPAWETVSPALARFADDITKATGKATGTDDVLDIFVKGTTDVGAFGAKGGEGGSELVSHFTDIFRAAHPDAAPGLITRGIQSIDQQAFQQALDQGNTVARLSSAYGNFGRIPKSTLEAMGVQKGPIEDGLKLMIGEGRGIVKKGAYEKAKLAAGALGQPRFRVSLGLPFVRRFGLTPYGLRWTQHRFLPTDLSRVGFQPLRRFFSGNAGITRLGKMVANKSAPKEALEVFVSDGFKEMRKRFPKVADELGRGAYGAGSIFVPVSEQVGGITSKFSVHAASLRGGGLGAILAADSALRSRQIREQTVNDILSITKQVGERRATTESRAVIKRITDLLKPVSTRVRFGQRTLEPEVQGWLKEFIRTGNEEHLTALRNRMGVEAADETVELFQTLAEQIADAPLRHGLSGTRYPVGHISNDSVRPDEVAKVQAGAHKDVVGKNYVIRGAGDEGVTVDMADVGGDDWSAYGIQGAEAEIAPLRDMTPEQTVASMRSKFGIEPPLPGYRRVYRGEGQGSIRGGSFFADTPTAARSHGESLYYVDVPESALKEAAASAKARGNVGYDLPDEYARIADDLPRELTPAEKRLNLDAPTNETHVVNVRNPAPAETAKAVNNEVRETFEAIGRGESTVDKELHDLTGVTNDSVRELVENEAALKEQIGRATTSLLKERGHDGVMSIDGKTVTTFVDEAAGGIPVWRVAKDAPRVAEDLGMTMHTLSRSAQEALDGAVKGGRASARRAAARIERAITGKSSAEAEEIIRLELGKLGAKVPDGVPALEEDLIKSVLKGADNVARDVSDQYMGRVMRRLDAMGFTKSPLHSGPVGIQRWRYVLDDAMLEELDKVSGAYRKAAERVTRLTTETLDHDRSANKMGERLQTVREKLDELGEGQLPEGAAFVRSEMRRQNNQLERKLRQFEATSIDVKTAIHDRERLAAKLHTQQARPMAALVPASDDIAGAGMERLDWLPGFEDMYMPTFMAQEFWSASRGFRHVDDFHKHWRNWMAWWKTYATYVVPGFHARNAMGAWFNNFLGGVKDEHYMLASRIRRAAWEETHGKPSKWTKMPIAKKDAWWLEESGLTSVAGIAADKATYSDLARAMSDVPGMSVGHSIMFGEANIGLEAMEKAALKDIPATFEKMKPSTYTLVRRYKRGMRGLGAGTENLMRHAAMVKELASNGGDWMGARAFTMMRHGDYADLTDFEYDFVRDVIPFYKWMRTNTPLQVHQLFEAPGKLLAAGKAKNALWGAAGMDYEKDKYKMPSWMRDRFTIPFGPDDARKIVTMDLPMDDLFMGGREFVSSFLPLIKPWVEAYGYEKELFSGRPLEGQPVPVEFNVFGPMLEMVGLAEQGKDGRHYVEDKTLHIMGIIPIFSRFRNFMSADPARAKLRASTFASAVFGVALRPQDQEEMTQAELDYYYNNILPELERLREMGYDLPTTKDLGAVKGTTDQILRSLGITPTVLE